MILRIKQQNKLAKYQFTTVLIYDSVSLQLMHTTIPLSS